jgi:hypothetical protein
LSQQPAGQVAAVQVVVTFWQPWFWQAWPEPQTWQAPPPLPQVCSVVPGTQAPAAVQQPFGQVAVPHWKLSQTFCALHCLPVPQSTQAIPPVPQAAEFVPGMQTPLMQQPVGQVVASQGFLMQTPALQTWSAPEQVEQVAPFAPHAVVVSPGMHWLFWQQPVGQLLGPQVGVSLVQVPRLHF